MNRTKTAINSVSLSTANEVSKWGDYMLLIKLRLSLLVVFSAVMAFLIAAQGAPVSWVSIVILGLGGLLVTGAANALNQVLERDYDKMMQRTANRPLAAGRMQVSEAVMAAGFMSLIGIVLLAMFNPWTAFLGTLSLISYAFVYTPMKRINPAAVFVGAIPGALPMMIGAVAFEGEITALALVLFAIQFIWQFPHFWAIAWLAHEDYQRAGFYLLPAKGGVKDKNTAMNTLVYAALLIPISWVPFYLGYTGLVSAIILTISAVVYTFYALRFYQVFDRATARGLMFSSFFYLPVVLIAMVFDIV